MVSPSASQPYRNQSLQCPRCRTDLGGEVLGHCARCRGSWVGEDVLKDRIAAMQHQVPPLVSWFLVERGALPCVTCAEPMQTLALFEVPVDRCRGHGIWFDAEELATVLLRSKDALADACPRPTPAAKPQPTSDSFGAGAAVDVAFVAVHLPVEVAAGAVSVGVAEVGAAAVETVAGGAAEAGLGVVGGVLEGILDGLTSLL